MFRLDYVELRRRTYRRAVRLLPYKLRHIVEYLRNYRRIPKITGDRHSERMLNRSLNDESQTLTDMCSKMQMKKMARERRGTLEISIPEVFWNGAAEELNDVLPRLPRGEWVLKPNNLGGGVVHFLSVREEPPRIPSDFIPFVNEQAFGYRTLAPLAWHRSESGYLIEERIGSRGAMLQDFKVHMFSRVPRILSVYSDRDAILSVSHFLLPYTGEVIFQRGPNPPTEAGVPEAELAKLMEAAAQLASDLEYLRIDFYINDGKIWFGEFSPFGGLEGIAARPDIDRMLGKWWTANAGGDENG